MLYFEYSYCISPVTINKTGGTEDAFMQAFSTNFEDLSVTGDVEYRLHGCTVTVFNPSGSNNTALNELPSNGEILPTYSDGTRPSAASVQPGQMIFNSSDNAPNISDGSDWRDMNGDVT